MNPRVLTILLAVRIVLLLILAGLSLREPSTLSYIIVAVAVIYGLFSARELWKRLQQ